MRILTTLDKVAEGVKEMFEKSKQEQIVLLPLAEYQALIERLEDLEDLIDHQEEMGAYRRGEGRPFKEFLSENADSFDIQG